MEVFSILAGYWLHGYIHLSKLTELYIYDLYVTLCVNFTSILKKQA